MSLQMKRVYEPSAASDGRRYLVDRLWPRGFSKDSLRLTEWLKEIAPSAELRKGYCHDPALFPQFRLRYRAELAQKTDLVGRLVAEAERGPVTLLFAARDVAHSNAAILHEYLGERTHPRPGRARGRSAR
jgi:uncharacterized protein YeaO (DUF488 family)